MSQNTRHILTLARTTEKCSSPWLPGWQVRALSLSFWPRWQWKPRIAACIFCSVAVSPQACKMPLTICAHNAKAATQQQNLFHAQLKKPKIKPQKKNCLQEFWIYLCQQLFYLYCHCTHAHTVALHCPLRHSDFAVKICLQLMMCYQFSAFLPLLMLRLPVGLLVFWRLPLSSKLYGICGGVLFSSRPKY